MTDTDTLTWERAASGTLLLRRERDNRTVALVVKSYQGCTFEWLHAGDRSQPYPTEEQACDALFDRLESWSWPTRRERKQREALALRRDG